MLIDVTWLEAVRVLFVLGITLVVPGALVVNLFPKRDSVPRSLYIPLAVGWSLTISILMTYFVRTINGSLTTLTLLITSFNLIGIGFLLVGHVRKGLPETLPSFAWSKTTGILVLLTVLWFIVVLMIGPRIDYAHDAWYHIAHIRQAADSNQVNPTNPYWPDVPLGRAYSTWHVILGSVVRASKADTLVVWHVGNAFLAALALPIIYTTAKTIFDDTDLSLLSAAAFMGAEKLTGTYVYPYGITNVLLWAALGLFFSYYKRRHRYLLLSATVVGLLPIAIHPQEYIFLCFGVAAFLIVTWSHAILNRFGESIAVKPIFLYLGLLLIIGAPLLVANYSEIVRANVASSANTPSSRHHLAQLLSFLFPQGYKLSSFKVEFLPFKATALIISPFLLSNPFGRDKNRFLLTLAWAPVLAYLVPGLSYATKLVLRETYAWRLIALIPAPMLIALILKQALPRRSRWPANASDTFKWVMRIIALILIVLLGLSVILKISVSRQINEEGTERDLLLASPLQAQAMFETLDHAAPQPSVVLSDPWTSYAVPGMTQHTVVLNMPAHGSREDMIVRYADMRKLLSSPIQSQEDAVDMLEAYNIEFIVVNKPQTNHLFYYFGLSFYSSYTLDFLRGNPACFENLYTDEIFEIYQFDHCDPDTLRFKGERPEPLEETTIDCVTDLNVNGDLTLLGYSLPTGTTVAPGSEISTTLVWKAGKPLIEPYAVWLELLCDYPQQDRPYGKVFRMIRERVENADLETSTAFWLPIPPSGLNEGDLLSQPFTLSLHPDMTAIGSDMCDLNTYVINREQALYNSDAIPGLLMERGYLHEGIKIARIELE
jgi:hypothetical protein